MPFYSNSAIFDFKKSLKVFSVLIFIIFFFFSCKEKKKKDNINLDESLVYSSQNFSDLSLDSTKILQFLNANPASDSIRHQAAQFYSWRGFQYAWVNQSGLSLAAVNFYDQLQSDSQDFADKSLISSKLDSLMIAANSDEKLFFKQPKSVERLELLLTLTFFKYAEKVYGGATVSTKDLNWFIPRKKKNYLVLLDSLVSQNTGAKLKEPVNEYYISLKEKLRLYRSIQQKGGFTPVISDKKVLQLGDSSGNLVQIKQHLFLTGDLTQKDDSTVFTETLRISVKNYQHRMGLKETGKIDELTIKELNQTIDFRIKQIMVNLERLRWVPVQMEKDYLLINIPEFRLHVFENRKQIWTANVVVGKAAKRTSIFRGNLSQIVLNPYWGIPTSIVQEEILPKIKQNPNYLTKNNMEVIDGNYRQKPGINNALGKIKFLFPNNYSIYLHDTPSKSLFNENTRAFSHGCIRVENPRKLAYYLLRNEPEWSPEKINDILTTDTMTNIIVRPTVPVYIAYFTAWVDNKGQLNFRNDLYNLDDKLSKEVFGDLN